MNKTIQKFDYPNSLIKEYDHWVLMLRPKQVTIGSCVIAAKCPDHVTSIGDLSPAAGAELITVIHDYEMAMKQVFVPIIPVKFNYMALMLVDPNPHFHAFPRFDRMVVHENTEYLDAAFPKLLNLAETFKMPLESRQNLRDHIAALIHERMPP